MTKSKSKKNVAEMPDFIHPMLATLTEKPFDSDEWLFELKWDGYRTLAFVQQNDVNLLSRNNLSFNELFQPIQKALLFLGFDCILDGEIVVLNKEGKADFNLIQSYSKTRKGTLVYYIFDILFLNGHDMQELPLINRKEILAAIPLPKVDEIQVCQSVKGKGIAYFNHSRSMNLEGIIAKKASSTYNSGRSKDWLKIKNTNNCEVVILGYTTSERKMFFASLILGYYKNGSMVFVGHAGTGFTRSNEKDLFQRFQPLKISTPAVKEIPVKYSQQAVWLKPELVCRVQFAEITSDGKMRHCSFKSLIQKSAKEITAIC